MANQILTPQMILKEAYAILHQSSNFIARTNRQYDDRFANRELKISQTLDVRLPPKYTTRDGNTMSQQNVVQRKVPLPLATIKGVDINLTQEQLTFDINDVSRDVLRPALTQLAATMEGDLLSTMYKQVWNVCGSVTTSVDFRSWQTAGKLLADNLAPPSDRTMTMNTQTRVDFSDSVKSLFQSSENIRQQYVDGMVGRTGGFDVFENTLMPSHTAGTFTTNPVITTSAASDTGFPGTGNAYTTEFEFKMDGSNPIAVKKGDVFTVSGVFECHPETKVSLGYLKRFVVAEDYSGTSGTHAITASPAPILGGAYQNCVGSVLDGAAVTFLGITSAASAVTYGQNLAFHRDAFAIVTADLEDPSAYGAWGSRQVVDGISMRIWRQGDIVNGSFPCRIDIAYGGTAIYPEWAARLVHSQSQLTL